MAVLLAGLTLLAILLLAYLARRPALTLHPLGRVLAFLGCFVLPVLITTGGTAHHLELSKSTAFCLSCHEMEPYGESLWIDDPDHLQAAHFQNRRIPRDAACYTCHTSYAMFGGVQAKLVGLGHVWVHFFGEEREPGELELYQPYRNRECLHCHAGARSFVSGGPHADLLAELRANELSCLDCHGGDHRVAEVGALPRWPSDGAHAP